MARPWVFLPLLLSAVLLLNRSLFKRKLEALHRDVGHYRRDSQRHTPLAVLFNLLQALPGAMLLALCGYALQVDARGQNAYLGDRAVRHGRGLAGALHRIPHPGSRRRRASGISAGRPARSHSSTGTCAG